jgi:hypothetical protein
MTECFLALMEEAVSLAFQRGFSEQQEIAPKNNGIKLVKIL